MTSVPQKSPSPQANTPAPSSNILRIVLFLVLGYMVFALAYDYLYVFKTHEAKFQELTKMVETETSRSADDRKEKGPLGPKAVQEMMGFGPASPLEKKEHYSHERYTFRRGLPFMTRNIDVFYKQYQGDSEPGIYSVAHTEQDLETATPTGPVPPNTDPEVEAPAPLDGKAGETSKDEKKTETPSEEVQPEEKKTEEAKPEEAPAEEKKADAPAEEKPAEETKE